MTLKVLEWATSLTFGGVVGGGIVAFLYIWYPQLFPNIAIEYATVGGAALGGCCQRLIANVVKSALYPLSKNDDFYEKLDELHQLRRTKQITEAQYQDIVSKLTEKRFLGSPTPLSSIDDNSGNKSLQ